MTVNEKEDDSEDMELPPFESPSISKILDHFLKYRYAGKVSEDMYADYGKVAKKMKEMMDEREWKSIDSYLEESLSEGIYPKLYRRYMRWCQQGVNGKRYKPTEIFGGEALRCLFQFSVDQLEKEGNQMTADAESRIPMFCKDLDKVLSDRHSLIYTRNFDENYDTNKTDENDDEELDVDTDDDEGKTDEAHRLKQKYDALNFGDAKRMKLDGSERDDMETEDHDGTENERVPRVLSVVSRTESDMTASAPAYEPSETYEASLFQEDRPAIEKALGDFYETGLASALKKEEKARQEEKEHLIQFRTISNDGKRDSYIILTGLKNIFMKQLPEMPKEYITRLVYDKNHLSLALLRENLAVIGGVTYRLFPSQKLAEIVFCAISSNEQVKGYGSLLMSHLKDSITPYDQIQYILTYADNYAIGYFKKQGFTTEVTLERYRWTGYIKDYDGGTLMQCSLVPKVKYLQVQHIVQRQKLAVWEKIKEQTNAHVVYPGLTVFKEAKAVSIPVEQIPGVIEAGWTPDMSKLGEQKRDSLYSLMRTLLSEMQNHAAAWPFLEPVNGDEVPDYYQVIKDPMDLQAMEERLEQNYYHTIDIFTADMARIFQNCRMYNGEDTVYVKCANKLEAFFKSRFNYRSKLLE